MYVRGYLQGSENGRVVTIEWTVDISLLLIKYLRWPTPGGKAQKCLSPRLLVILGGVITLKACKEAKMLLW
jgi:hypothetical protein